MKKKAFTQVVPSDPNWSPRIKTGKKIEFKELVSGRFY